MHLDKLLATIYDFLTEYVEKKFLNPFLPKDVYPEEWDLTGLVNSFQKTFTFPGILTLGDIDGKTRTEISDFLIGRLKAVIEYKESVIPTQIFFGFLKQIFLQVLDSQWEDHINQMTMLQQGIFLQAYGQKNPLIEFKQEAHTMFEEMQARIKEDYTYICVAFWIEVR